jgi:hypothetical protein
MVLAHVYGEQCCLSPWQLCAALVYCCVLFALGGAVWQTVWLYVAFFVLVQLVVVICTDMRA